MTTLTELMDKLPQTGTVRWIGLRPARRETIEVVNSAEAQTETGLVGDRYAGRSGNRQVTLIQYEHLTVITSCLSIDEINPATLRRNIAVSGVNLLALKNKTFQIGTATLAFTGLCHPCSFMEEALGEGGYNAVRGHGGITARVVENGLISVGDSVAAIATAQE